MIYDDSAGDVKMEDTHARLLLLCDERLKFVGKYGALDLEIVSAQHNIDIFADSPRMNYDWSSSRQN